MNTGTKKSVFNVVYDSHNPETKFNSFARVYNCCIKRKHVRISIKQVIKHSQKASEQ